MNLLTAQEVSASIGKKKVFGSQSVVGKAHYLTGVKDFDEVIYQNEFSLKNIVNLFERKNGIELSMMHKFKMYHVALPYSELVSVTLEDREQILEKKERSVIGRAFLGGLILGVPGAIIGGMTGLKDGVQKIGMPDLMLTIEMKSTESDNEVIVISCDFKHKKLLQGFFKATVPDKFELIDLG